MMTFRTPGHGTFVLCCQFIILFREADWSVVTYEAATVSPVVVFERHSKVYTLSFAKITRSAILDCQVKVQFFLDPHMVPHKTNACGEADAKKNDDYGQSDKHEKSCLTGLLRLMSVVLLATCFTDAKPTDAVTRYCATLALYRQSVELRVRRCAADAMFIARRSFKTLTSVFTARNVWTARNLREEVALVAMCSLYVHTYATDEKS